MAGASGIDFVVGFQNEIQNISTTGGNSDTFRLVFEGSTSSTIAQSDAPGAVETALESAGNINSGDVSVSGSSENWDVEFKGQYLNQDVSLMKPIAATDTLSVTVAEISTSVYEVIGGQTEGTLDREIDTAEITNKQSNKWQEQIQTIRSWALDVDNIIIKDTSTAQKVFRDAYFNNRKLKVRVTTPVGNTYIGDASVNFTEEGPYDDTYNNSASFEGDGILNKV